MTSLIALSTIASKQTKATEKTMKKSTQLLNYLASNLDAKFCVYASEMVMNIHSDASYFSEAKACSHTSGHFFMGHIPKCGEPRKLNRASHVDSSILQFVVVLADEAELGALFHNCQTGIIFRNILET